MPIFLETENSPLVRTDADEGNGGDSFPLQSLVWRVSHYRVTASSFLMAEMVCKGHFKFLGFSLPFVWDCQRPSPGHDMHRPAGFSPSDQRLWTASLSLAAASTCSVLSSLSSISAALKEKKWDGLDHCIWSFDPPCCPWAVKDNFWQAMSDVTGNLVGLSGNVLYKFEALVGGIFLVFSAFKLTPDLSVVPCRAPRCQSMRF